MSTRLHAGGRPRPNHRPRPALAPTLAPAPAVATPALPGPFDALGVPAPLVAALRTQGVTAPFAIQEATLPDALAGRDVLGRAQTGSGKTIAFAVPLVAELSRGDHRRSAGQPAGLILVPTRELAAQVAKTVAPLARAVGLRCATVHGGVSQGPQIGALRRGVDVIVATPGRLEDLIGQGHCQLDRVRVTVLDEADHLADLGFLPAVRRLLDQTPSGGQRLLFSATLDDAITGLAQRYLQHPATHNVDAVDASPDLLDHHLFKVQSGDKAAVVAELASGAGRSLLFTRTKYGAQKLARNLNGVGIPAVELHSNLSQSVRQRNLGAFADGAVRVLVATDIAARGVHVDDIALVVHVDPPAEHKAYLHRSGRTARAGARGAVVTIATPDQVRDVNALLRKAHIRPTAGAVVPGDRRTTDLTGPVAPPEATGAIEHLAAARSQAADGPRRSARHATTHGDGARPKPDGPRTPARGGTGHRDGARSKPSVAQIKRRQPPLGSPSARRRQSQRSEPKR